MKKFNNTQKEYIPKYSSNILKIVWNVNNTLEVTYVSRSGGTAVYNYYNVPYQIYAEFIAADKEDKSDSVGKYANRVIKKLYDTETNPSEQVIGY